MEQRKLYTAKVMDLSGVRRLLDTLSASFSVCLYAACFPYRHVPSHVLLNVIVTYIT